MATETSLFSGLEQPPVIELYYINQLFVEDKSKDKVGLGAGVYRDINGELHVLPVVRIAEEIIYNDKTLSKDYSSVLGLESLRIAATKMLLGEDNIAIKENRAFGIQCLSGNGSLRVGAEFLAKVLGRKIFYYSNPTWGNHKLIFHQSGFKEGRGYRYWSHTTRDIDFEGFLEDLQNAPEDAVVIFHACAHNPTGSDPSQDQWKQIARVVKERKLFPVFDSAYQGFASGDLIKDAWAVRHFVNEGIELFCAQSFAKNFGFYSERVGNLTIVLNNSEYVAAVKSQMAPIARGMYGSPPLHGARIVSYVLNNLELYKQWLENVRTMSDRVINMRKQFREHLERLGTPGDWSHVTKQIGMFSYTGLTETQSRNMLNKYHIYMPSDGRITMCGLTPSNVELVAKALYDTVVNVQ